LLHRLAMPALANAVLLVSAYLAVASLMWGFADASMQQPVDLAAFDAASSRGRSWRVAHLSDLHVIGDQYGFASKADGPVRAAMAGSIGCLAHLAAIHAIDPLDHILITGDMTDAGRAGEWAAFLDAIAHHPELADAWSCCRAITTSTSSTAPIRPGSTCRSARASGCGKSAPCRRWRPCKAIACAWSMPGEIRRSR
jgi:3',5'-cyclic AMP phosphodiesterase CpdA